jgi:nitroreductase
VEIPMLPGSASGIEDAKNTLRIMREAPVTICVVDPDGYSPFEELNPDQRFTEINSTLSIGAAVENLILKATELGYGTLWIGNTCFAYQELLEELNVDGQLVCAIAVGIPAESPEARPRKPLDEIAEFRGD